MSQDDQTAYIANPDPFPHPAVAAEAPNIIGVKLTCGAVGKLSRLVSLRPDFAVLAGFIDIMGPGIMMGSKGAITGLANVAPVSFGRFGRLGTGHITVSATLLTFSVISSFCTHF